MLPFETRLRDIIEFNNEYLLTFARENLYAGEKIGTTIVAAVIRNETLQIAHVGDSRAYLIRNGEIRQLTTDHSFVNELIRSRAITEEEAQKSPYRNRLLRSVGASDAKLEVDVTEPIPLQAGDMLLLCTDGLDAVCKLTGHSGCHIQQGYSRVCRWSHPICKRPRRSGQYHCTCC